MFDLLLILEPVSQVDKPVDVVDVASPVGSGLERVTSIVVRRPGDEAMVLPSVGMLVAS